MAARDGFTLEQKQAWMREKHSTAVAAIPLASTFTEQHYTVAEVGGMWNLSPDAVRKIFEKEPGVLIVGGHGTGTRRYRTLRIPASIAERVHRRLSNV